MDSRRCGVFTPWPFRALSGASGRFCYVQLGCVCCTRSNDPELPAAKWRARRADKWNIPLPVLQHYDSNFRSRVYATESTFIGEQIKTGSQTNIIRRVFSPPKIPWALSHLSPQRNSTLPLSRRGCVVSFLGRNGGPIQRQTQKGLSPVVGKHRCSIPAYVCNRSFAGKCRGCLIYD